MLQNSATQGMIAMVKRVYLIKPILINGIFVKKVLIDPHVDKHGDHMNDELILKLLRELYKYTTYPVGKRDEFAYYVNEVKYESKWYKMVWLLNVEEKYLGIITVFRDRRIK